MYSMGFISSLRAFRNPLFQMGNSIIVHSSESQSKFTGQGAYTYTLIRHWKLLISVFISGIYVHCAQYNFQFVRQYMSNTEHFACACTVCNVPAIHTAHSYPNYLILCIHARASSKKRFSCDSILLRIDRNNESRNRHTPSSSVAEATIGEFP